jgi:hypothetical protein
MAGQRSGQPGRHGRRRGAGRAGLGLALSLLLTLAACGDADGPDPFEPGTDQDGTSGPPTSDTALLGTWRNVTIIQVPGDLQRWTTIWLFDAAGLCRQTVETESLAEGFPRVTERTCSYGTSSGEITIHYLEAGTLTFDYSFAGFSPDRLVLDGFEYERVR